MDTVRYAQEGVPSYLKKLNRTPRAPEYASTEFRPAVCAETEVYLEHGTKVNI